MALVALQCGECEFGKTFRWKLTEKQFEEGSPGDYVCSQFPTSIPSYVEEGTEDCPKFVRKSE
jgi:hypothetical protein